jgi:hypothetical protein
MPASQVTALYAGRALSFALSKDATLWDLADHLEQSHVIGWQDEMPTAICLKFAPPRSEANLRSRP